MSIYSAQSIYTWCFTNASTQLPELPCYQSPTFIYPGGQLTNFLKIGAARDERGEQSLRPSNLFGTVPGSTLQVYPQQCEVGGRDPANAPRLGEGPGPELR